MSKYVENNLRKDEKIVLKAKKNPLALTGAVLLVLICIAIMFLFNYFELPISAALPLLIVSLINLLLSIIRFCTMVLAVTNKRVIGRVGIIKKEILDYPIEKVNAVSLKSSLWGAIFRYQNIKVESGNANTSAAFKGISNANEFKNTVTDAIEKHQEDARRMQAEEIARAMRGGR